MAHSYLRTAFLTLAAAALLAGCGSSTGAEAGSPGGTPSPSPTTVRSVEQRCGTKPPSPGKPVTFPSAGTTIYGAEFGTGPRGVILVHQVDSRGMCMWLDRVPYLVDHGYHVLAFDQRCYGDSGCPDGKSLAADAIAAAGELRELGATSVVAVGASQGASVAVIAAGRDPDAFDAVIALSGNLTTEGYAADPPDSALAAAPDVTVPIVYAVAKGDSVTVADTRKVERATGSADKRLVVLPSRYGHGIQTLYTGADEKPSPFNRDVVMPFLAKHSR